MTLASSAQIEKGSWILGGTFNFNNSDAAPPGFATSNASVSPHLGLAAGRNSVMGLSFGFFYSNSGNGQTAWTFSANPFYRKYIPLKNKLGCYLQFYSGLAWTKSVDIFPDSTGASVKHSTAYNSYNLGFTPGLYYQVSPGVLLNLDAGGISYFYADYGHGQWSSSLRAGLFEQFSFGVDFILGKKS